MLINYNAEEIIEALSNTWENNTLKFVVLFGEDSYFLGSMRSGDEYPQKTFDEIVRKLQAYEEKPSIEKVFRLQNNSGFFRGVLTCIREKEKAKFNLNILIPEDGKITQQEYINYYKFLMDYKAIIGNDNCSFSIGKDKKTKIELNKKLALSVSKNKEGRVFFSKSYLPMKVNSGMKITRLKIKSDKSA